MPVVDVYELAPLENQLRCDDAGCVYHKGSPVIAMPILAAAALEDCAKADVIVTPFVVKNCGSAVVIDDPELWHHGAHALYFNGASMTVKYVREHRAMRPWSPGWGWKYD